jgi:hypothetical protein
VSGAVSLQSSDSERSFFMWAYSSMVWITPVTASSESDSTWTMAPSYRLTSTTHISRVRVEIFHSLDGVDREVVNRGV